MSNIDVLVFFPYAGGGKNAYDLIIKHCQGDIQTISLSAHSAPFPSGIDEIKNFSLLAENFKKQLLSLKGRIAFFGHSMGAILAYEVALRCSFKINLVKFIVSACITPDNISQSGIFSGQGEEILNRVVSLGGVPRLITSEPLRFHSVKNRLSQDLTLLARYRRESYPKLDCAIDACSAREDRLAPQHEMHNWKNFTTNVFSLNNFEGDHFYFRQSGRELASLINKRTGKPLC